MTIQGYRARLFSLHDDPAGTDDPSAKLDCPDGLLVVEDGTIIDAGPYADLAPRWDGRLTTVALPGRLITPGFIDAHIHYPQTGIIAAYGAGLLDWLERYTFPAEMAFSDSSVARETAKVFLTDLLRHGTTSALVFGTVHTGSIDALFEEAYQRRMRIIAGKVLMDRGAPAALCDPPGGGIAETDALIKAWSGRGRLGYAITPRFAITSSPAQLRAAGEALARHPQTLLHTHLSETPQEIAETARLYPDTDDYLHVYESFGLAGPRSVFAHCLHMDDADLRRLAASGAAIAHCPTSNLFLGSGLFRHTAARHAGVVTALGTDIGAGTSFSLLATMGEAYKVARLQGMLLAPLDAFFMATLGGARALHIADKVGRLAPGYEADFLVIDPYATPILARRSAMASTIADLLFGLMILGDDRAIARTYIDGRLAYDRDA